MGFDRRSEAGKGDKVWPWLKKKGKFIVRCMRDRDLSFDFAVQAGVDLIEIKKELVHGQFDRWKQETFAEVECSGRTLTNYMKLAEIVNEAEKTYGPAVREQFRKHGATVWYDVPKKKRAEIIRKVATGELADRSAINAVVKGAKKQKNPIEAIGSLFWKIVDDGDLDPLDLAAAISSKLLTEAREQEGKNPRRVAVPG